jgi:hypothetical protein
MMRTRLLDEGGGILSQIQDESGCRIHIERKLHEVRLFGLPEQRSAANKLLDSFAREVKEANVEVSTAAMIEESLQSIASSCGVTFLTRNDGLVVLGLIRNVDKAIQEIEQNRRPKSGFEVNAETRQTYRPSYSQPMVSPCATAATTQYVREASGRNTPAVKQSAHTQHSPTAHGAHGSVQENSACPTCGCGKFCTSCGAQISAWQYTPMVMPQQGYFPANAMLIPCMMAPQCHGA